MTTEEINENGSKNEAFLLSTPRKWIYILLICLCGLHIIIYLFLYVLLGQLPSCGCLLYRKERFPVPTAATRDTCTLPLSVCFFVARSAEVINKVQRASKTDRERRRHSRSDHKLWDSQSLWRGAPKRISDRKGQTHVTGPWLRFFFFFVISAVFFFIFALYFC